MLKKYLSSFAGCSTDLQLLFLGFGVASVCMTLLNKQLSHVLAEPFSLLVLQNLVGCALGWGFSYGGWIPIHSFDRQQATLAFLDSIIFSTLICSSMYALSFSSTALVVVFRNSSPLLMLLIEWMFLGGKVRFRECVFLLCTLCGTVVYSLGDLTADKWSFFWCNLNLVLACVVGAVEKWITTKLGDTQTAAGIFFLRNLFSAALLAPLSIWMSVYPTHTHDNVVVPENPYSPFYITLAGLSCVFGYMIGFCYFMLQQRTTPVSINVANCTYKLLTVAAGFFLFTTQYHFYMWIGLPLSFVGSFGYIYERTKGCDSDVSYKIVHLVVLLGLVAVTGTTVMHYLQQHHIINH